MTDGMSRVAAEVAARFRLNQTEVNTAIDLLRAGESVPFIACYRKVQTKGMKAAALRQLLQQLTVDAERERRLLNKKVQKKNLKSEESHNVLSAVLGEDDTILEHFRNKLWEEGVLSSVVLPKLAKKSKKSKNARKFPWAEYVYHKTPIQTIPKRRLHVLFRGRSEQALSLHVSFLDEGYGERYLASKLRDESKEAIQSFWEKKILPKLEVETLARLQALSDDEMIYGLQKQLQGLLLRPKAPSGVLMGLYADGASGLGVAVIDATGGLLDTCTLFPSAQGFRWHDAITVLAKYVATYQVRLIGVGNGAHLQELERLLADFMKRYPDMPVASIAVDEAGMLRGVRALPGAISIVRRLQDPLLELLEVPIAKMQLGGVEEEVNPRRLSKALTGVIEDTVNRIGVDANTASLNVLCYVSGFDKALAKSLIDFRKANGLFQTREDLKQIPGMDAKRFEQSAGFLKIVHGKNALDATRLHPKDYALLDALDSQSSDVRRVLEEQRLSWRDPRPAFKQPTFEKQVNTLEDLKVGMKLEGVVSRITTFGAFIDIGVQQPGLLHISELTTRFVRDPHEVLHVGDVVRVTIIQLDVVRRRIGLGMKSEEKTNRLLEVPQKKRKNKIDKQEKAPILLNTAMADAFAKLKRGSS
ncbi:MAG: helix-hairpin-helix domain-containing protein [Gammaproteobacteria bacterium]|nr:helix-hairpin-helix domain-containing protein [Gammaproteobacteria bacterium]